MNYKTHFPIFENARHPHSDAPLTYLDSAASTQKPKAVLNAMQHFYTHDYANIHRGVYHLSATSTTLYEQARETVARFYEADKRNVIFTSGVTDAINLVTQTWGRTHLKRGDSILLSQMEHHAMIVPWRMLADEIGFSIRWIPVTTTGELDLSGLESLIDHTTKLIGCVHVSNTLGTVNDVKTLCALARSKHITTLIDGAQTSAHRPVDVQSIGCDFYVVGAHKAYGPNGVGALIARSEILDSLPPYRGGGDMIETVGFDSVRYAEPPARFEAGTPNIEGVIGFAAALDFISDIGFDAITAHEQHLTKRLLSELLSLKSVRIIGTADDRIGNVSFVVDGIHPHDIGTFLDHHHICVRTGHHCTQPLMDVMGVTGTIRASIGLYNDDVDITRFIAALHQAIAFFKP